MIDPRTIEGQGEWFIGKSPFHDYTCYSCSVKYCYPIERYSEPPADKCFDCGLKFKKENPLENSANDLWIIRLTIEKHGNDKPEIFMALVRANTQAEALTRFDNECKEFEGSITRIEIFRESKYNFVAV